MYEEMKKVDGFALATTVDMRIMGMNMHSETIATEVRKGPIPDDVFAPPAGDNQKKSPYQKGSRIFEKEVFCASAAKRR